jgi:hypothetical protein
VNFTGRLQLGLKRTILSVTEINIMTRKSIDCRQIPSDKHCTLAISGAEEEVLDLAVIHAIISHGHDDPYELRNQIRSLLTDAPAAKSASA